MNWKNAVDSEIMSRIEELTPHSVTSTTKHTFPGGTTTFLRADGTFAAPGGGGGIAFRLVARWQEPRTFTNIGTAFVNVYNLGLNGQRQLVDFAGFTNFRLLTHLQNIGASVQNIRLLDDVTPANILSDLADDGIAGEKELDSGWVALPAWANVEKFMRLEMKATVATNDPVFRAASLYLK